MYSLSTSSQHCTGGSTGQLHGEQIKLGQEKVKLPLILDDIIPLQKTLKNPLTKLLGIIISSRLKDTRSIHKNQFYFYTFSIKI